MRRSEVLEACLRRRTFGLRVRNDGGSREGWLKHESCQGKLEKEGSRVTATWRKLEHGEAS